MSDARPLPSQITTGRGGSSRRHSRTIEITLGPPSTMSPTTGTPCPSPVKETGVSLNTSNSARFVSKRWNAVNVYEFYVMASQWTRAARNLQEKKWKVCMIGWWHERYCLHFSTAPKEKKQNVSQLTFFGPATYCLFIHTCSRWSVLQSQSCGNLVRIHLQLDQLY